MKEQKYNAYLKEIGKFIPKDRIYTDELRLLAWGTDAGFYRLIPKIVIRAKDENEVSRLLALADKYTLPVTFRAAGTSLSGQSISDSILIVAGKNWEKYSISEDFERITLQPGIIGARVNEILKPHGRKFAPDPASVKSAMVGGIVMNNASGMNCGTHANSDKELLSAKIVLADGTRLNTGDPESRTTFERKHTPFLNKIIEIRDEIRNDNELSDRIRKKYSIKNVLPLFLGVLVMVTVIVSGATALLPVDPKVVFYILLVPLFLAYRVIVDADIVKCFATFLLSFAIMSFCKNYAIMIDAVIHPELGVPTFSTDGALIQLGISCAVTAAIAYPVAKYGSHLINGLPYRRVWLISIVMSLMFIGFNFTVQPVHYQTLYLNRVFLVYILITTLMFVMLVLMYTVFYFIASALLKAGKDKEHISVLEMQKKQYDAQQKYLEDTSRIRHDFKHSIIAIKTLAEDGDIEELKSYLDNYIDTFPSRSPVRYCGNYALNALLSHFEEQAQQHGITLRLRIDTDNKEEAVSRVTWFTLCASTWFTCYQ